MVQQPERQCPRCGHAISASERYCGNCGFALTGSEEKQQTLITQPPPPLPASSDFVFPPEPTTPPAGHTRKRTTFISVLVLLLVGLLLLGLVLGKAGLLPIKTGSPPPTRAPIPNGALHTWHVILLAHQGVPGLNTGIELTADENLTIIATGEATQGPATDATHCYGHPINPDGVSNVNGTPCTHRIGSSVDPSAPVGTLLGSIGQVGTNSLTGWFVVGSHYSSTVLVNGPLYLIFNDAPRGYFDNQGSYQVTITVQPGNSTQA
jgi:predicted nucleic acid-binding Zn ribbon protein